MKNNGFYIGAYWQRRGETPRELALRVRCYATLARNTLPPEFDWYTSGERVLALCQTEEGSNRLETYIADGVAIDQKIKDPGFGYIYNFYLAKEDPAPSFTNCSMIHLSGGASEFQNCCVFTSQGATSDTTDPCLTTYDVMRAHMMAIVWAFQPSWCTAAPTRLNDFLDRDVYVRPPIGLGWMTWLEPGLAGQMRPPPSFWNTITEAYADGSVFMANGKETFDVETEQHLQGARAIHRQLDHINYIVPFEGMCGRSPRVPPFPNPPPATWNAFDDPPI